MFDVTFPKVIPAEVNSRKPLILTSAEEQERQAAILMDFKTCRVAVLSTDANPHQQNIADKLGQDVLILGEQNSGELLAILPGTGEQAVHLAALFAAAPTLYEAAVMACQVLNDPSLQPADPARQQGREDAHRALLAALGQAHAQILMPQGVMST